MFSQIMTEARDEEAQKELTGLADKVGVAIERLQRKRMAAEIDSAEGPK